MLRILLVDDSPAVRELVRLRLKERGYEVICASDPLEAAELAMRDPPDVVVTDLWMPGVSGVQLCRLLRAEPSTAHVPVILITAESQRRSRFWAKTAGAAAYVAKDDLGSLYDILTGLAVTFPTVPAVRRAPPRAPMQHRLFQRLDADLFASVVAGEVRALAQEDHGSQGSAEAGSAGGEELASVFRGLARLVSEVTAYRWLAMTAEASSALFVHAAETDRGAAEVEARVALGMPEGSEVCWVSDDRTVSGRASPPVVASVMSGGKTLGRLALGPPARGASRDDQDLVAVVAAELGGPLRMAALVEQSRRLAMCDPLTGLLNRRALTEQLTRGLAGLERYGAPLSIMLLDVDHFKQVNDTNGHDAGDAVLVALADVLRGFARRTDVVARWGGEEFLVGLSHTAGPACLVPAERLRRAIAERIIRLPNGRDIRVTASIGVAAASGGEGLEALVARADQAMYEAKARGRNRCVLSQAPVRARSSTMPPRDTSAVGQSASALPH